jgi:hypothetical protein
MRIFVLKMTFMMFLGIFSQAAHADWLQGAFDDRCDPAVSNSIADAVRNQIEDQVARAEASIRPPSPIGDLSCLTDLMTSPIDIFSNIGGIFGNLMGGLTSFPSVDDLGNQISRQICQFAEQKWNEVSRPLTDVGNINFDVPRIPSF